MIIQNTVNKVSGIPLQKVMRIAILPFFLVFVIAGYSQANELVKLDKLQQLIQNEKELVQVDRRAHV